ncbi:MAG: GNAT family N-acetyltransferase [Gemmatimonadaceae bacterium]|nr:GNAT family N-acetyltransferase [Gemmatimonadaceae bacterium]
MQVDIVASAALTATQRDAVVALCTAAYEEPFAAYLTDIGPGVHLLGTVDGQLVSHLMWVPRTLYLDGGRPLETAYVEAVATQPAEQGKGYATRLMRAVPALVEAFDLAALSPSDEAWYARLGWEMWRGPLSVRDAGGVVETPDEEVMILRLPKTPAGLNVSAPLACDWRPGEVW